ncbi:DUF4118 domain-containing protein [Salmonella enterica]|nr:DUF4118 domain-containing protein [Salmonella enterica]EGW7168061.1 DUF4118 domain-containing protein [Salmonella enterica]
MNDEPLRPDPDRLLEQTPPPHRGKLKIFFGACAGVGKTWAMLAQAQRLRAQGLDVVIGVVETHGREETAALLDGLTILPPKRHSHRGRQIREFDLDAALARRPALILMDELAHSNAPGSRHPKRWQDIEELLEAGIDVFTTVNVQHLESLNDVVSGVTGIQVRETVPDPFFDAADEVVLVDLPPDDLRQRLNEGKVYIAGQAERAIEHFFRKGNLIALRELALRRTADRVDDQMRAWRAPDLDQVIVALEEPPARALAQTPDNRPFKEKWRGQIQGCLVAVALCAITTLIAMQWLVTFDAANLVMLYLLGVVVIALLYGRWPSVVATVINVASFDLFFIAPRGTLAVSDVQYLLTFAVMLTVGLVIGNLTAGVRYQARVARYREQRTRHLYEMSKALAVGRSEHDIAATSERFIASTFQARSQILLPDANGKLLPLTHQQGMTPWDDAIARWSFDKGQPAGAGTDTLPGVPYQILPLKSADKTYGLAIVEPGNLRQLMVPEQQRLLETFTLLVANALERLTLTASEEQARLASERESIRNALLAALSHDLRTPLTVLFGQAEILTLDLASAGSPHARQASEIRQHILNTTRLVNNLLDMARIQSGGFNLKKEWLTLEEVVGSALQMLEPGLLHPITLSLPQQLTLIHVDGPLFERVLINLLENAVKYAGPQASIGIDAAVKDDRLQLDVWDNGPGIPAGQEQKIFDKFARGNKESAVPGVGLGLAICHAIVEVHGGTLTAYNRPQGGACFRVTLPQGKPPELDDFHEDM